MFAAYEKVMGPTKAEANSHQTQISEGEKCGI